MSYCCISFVFYIKPQPLQTLLFYLTVVYLSFSTSNHNRGFTNTGTHELYIFRFLHQTTTPGNIWSCFPSCISFVFYIKPQLPFHIPTLMVCCISFVFYIKPQLSHLSVLMSYCCISFVFYIKPQLKSVSWLMLASCISFVFYIKPQLNY